MPELAANLKRGIPIVAGGTLDQPVVLYRACQMYLNEVDRYQSAEGRRDDPWH